MLEWYIIRYMMQNGLPLHLHLPMIRKNVLLNRPRLLQHLIWRHVRHRLTVCGKILTLSLQNSVSKMLKLPMRRQKSILICMLLLTNQSAAVLMVMTMQQMSFTGQHVSFFLLQVILHIRKILNRRLII